ncbi:MAG TPA: hypothetical protein VFA10_29215, partial [Ktedonobacteraceae bacterium]|nr:hypothetical protein [Ktedonobacteraceae bacterium]
GSEAIAQVFTDLMERIKLLSAEDQAVVRPIVEQAHDQANKIQQGNNNAQTQTDLEKRLRSLIALAPDIAKVTIAALANPVVGVATAIQAIAKKVLGE